MDYILKAKVLVQTTKHGVPISVSRNISVDMRNVSGVTQYDDSSSVLILGTNNLIVDVPFELTNAIWTVAKEQEWKKEAIGPRRVD